MRSRCSLFSLAALALLAVSPSPARGYESSSTHPGITGQALLHSARLHPFLRQDLGLALGLFARLKLAPAGMDRRELRQLQRRLASLDAGGGYRPDGNRSQRVVGWLMAGSVLAGMPSATEEDHFYSPVLRAGLDNSRPIVGSLLGLISVVEGGDRLRHFLTGTGFDLRGASALDLVRGPRGAYSAPVIHGHLADAVADPDPSRRERHLVMALLAMGGLLHVLQDMASPTRTRNDFVPGHLQQLGSSSFDRGSAYERGVALAFGQLGVPAYRGERVVRRRLLDFFSSADWRGLADHTAAEHFSPGTVPPPVRVLPTSDAAELREHLSSRLPFSRPALGPLDLRCARRRTCHQWGPHGPLLAYRIDEESWLRFFIDGACIAASARRLLPQAVAYSSGAIDFLLRGRLRIERGEEGGAAFLVRNGDQTLRSARLRVLVEDPRGRRRVIGSRTLPATAAGATLVRVPTLPAGSQRLLALLEGVDEAGEPLLAAGHLLPAEAQHRGGGATGTGARPASPPASAPAAPGPSE